MFDRKRIGRKGEDQAAKFLAQQGFKIIERNYWRKWGEIDLIAQKDKIVHFIEVKTVCRDPFVFGASLEGYEPEDNIHFWKRQRLRRVIETYVLGQKQEIDWQVDVIAVYFDLAGKQCFKIDWLSDVAI